MRRSVRTGWVVAGSTLTAAAVLAAPLGMWPALTRMHQSSAYGSSALPGYQESRTTVNVYTLTAPAIVFEATGTVNVTVVAGSTGQFSVRREITWTRGEPDLSQRWDGQTLTVAVGCKDEPCEAVYTLSVPAGVAVTAADDSVVMTDERVGRSG